VLSSSESINPRNECLGSAVSLRWPGHSGQTFSARCPLYSKQQKQKHLTKNRYLPTVDVIVQELQNVSATRYGASVLH
jgi:hypothetical protein